MARLIIACGYALVIMHRLPVYRRMFQTRPLMQTTVLLFHLVFPPSRQLISRTTRSVPFPPVPAAGRVWRRCICTLSAPHQNNLYLTCTSTVPHLYLQLVSLFRLRLRQGEQGEGAHLDVGRGQVLRSHLLHPLRPSRRAHPPPLPQSPPLAGVPDDPLSTSSKGTLLYCTLLYCTVLYCTVLYCTDTVLFCSVLFCTVLYSTVLCCTVLFCLCRWRDGSEVQLTDFPHPYPSLTGVSKEIIKYELRGRGAAHGQPVPAPGVLRGSATGPLPLLMWAYPREYKSKDAAGQVGVGPGSWGVLYAASVNREGFWQYAVHTVIIIHHIMLLHVEGFYCILSLPEYAFLANEPVID